MANQVLQPSAALAIITSDDYDIPFHIVATKGVVSNGASFQLKDDTVDFIALGIKPGMTVWNEDTASAAIVTSVDVDSLDISEDIFTSAGEKYSIYSEKNTGCLIRIGSGKNNEMTVTTQGGDKVTFKNLSAGTILPVRIARVWSTGTEVSNLVALW